jgi:hypothetical protein
VRPRGTWLAFPVDGTSRTQDHFIKEATVSDREREQDETPHSSDGELGEEALESVTGGITDGCTPLPPIPGDGLGETEGLGQDIA